jgi:NAD-reducing hydrogenase large subunit
MKTLVIDPVTRIEGHAKITIHLDDDGQVTDTFFHVTQLRGFEKFVEGRPFYTPLRSEPENPWAR